MSYHVSTNLKIIGLIEYWLMKGSVPREIIDIQIFNIVIVDHNFKDF